MGLLDKFFKEDNTSAKSIFDTPAEVATKKEAQRAIIREIHNSFFTEVDHLIEMANKKEPLTIEDKNKFKKGEHLASLGFTSTESAKYTNKVKNKNRKIERENIEKDKLIKAIKYFQLKYPQYKFITEESVKRICEKYNLVYATVDKYTGTVPDKNLEEIANFLIKPEDALYLCTRKNPFSSNGSASIATYEEYKKGINEEKLKKLSDIDRFNLTCNPHYYYSKAAFEIVAPLSDFNLKGYEVKDFKVSKIEIPDPIVLQPVCFEQKKYYLVVTAWGDEASDPSVVNEINN